jgi:hypothetical protein
MSLTSAPVRLLRPQDLLDEQLDLHVWWESPMGKRFAEGWTRDVDARRGLGDLPTFKRDFDHLWIAQSAICRTGVPILIQPDMVELVDHAAKTMPSQVFREDDLPAEFGFLYLAQPVDILDLHGTPFAVRAITWGIANVNDPRELASPKTDPRGGSVRGVVVGYYTSARDNPGDPFEAGFAERGEWKPDLSLLHLQALEFGEDFCRKTFFHPPRDRVEQPDQEILSKAEDATRHMVKFVLCTWTIMQQRIAATHRERPNRPQIRRWGRRKADPPEVVVVTLRRAQTPQEPGEEATMVNWTHRWFVNGHWRRIHNHEGEERLVYVSPHIKGPEHLPLVHKDRVYNFRR